MFDYKEVYNNCLKYFNGDELAASVIVNKYLLKNKEDKYLEKEPEDLFNRIISEFERIEKKYPNSLTKEEITEAIKDFKYVIPQGSPLFGIGNNEQLTSIGNCFVVGQPFDSYSGILRKDEELAQIMKRRGGVGIDISTLRPRGAPVGGAAGTSDGITGFIERYSNTTKEVAQNGRRGALMISLHCQHPQIEDFIIIKRDLSKVTGANLSVKWTDEFLKAVEEDREFTLRFPVDATIEKAQITKVIKAKEVWKKFVEAAHASAEPGCLFWDTIINKSPSDCYKDFGFETMSTNPCGELPLSTYGACILMLLNLTSFVDNKYTDKAKFNFKLFEKYSRIALKLIDDMIDLEIEKIDKIINLIDNSTDCKDQKNIKFVEKSLWTNIKDTYLKGRKVGLGITGYGDMLAMLNLKYGSKEAIKFTEEVFSKYHYYSYDTSSILASERGSFPIWNWELEKYNYYINLLPKETISRIKKTGRRNIACNTCSPTGSISILTQTTSGIEPVFKREYKRRKKITQIDIDNGVKIESTDNDGTKWTSYNVFHKGLEDWKKINPSKDIKDSPYYGVEASEIEWRLRVESQAVIQKYVDNSLSSTTNLPATTTVDEVSEIYLQAWRKGCKGITIYREGSRQGILLDKNTETSNEKELTKIRQSIAPKRPKVLECDIHYSTIKENKWVVFVGLLNNQPYEIFGGKKELVEIPKKYKKGWIVKNGLNTNGERTYDLYLGTLEESDERLIIKGITHAFNPDAGSYTRIISTMLRHGIPINFICEQLYKDSSDGNMFSFECGIARVLKKYITDGSAAGVCPQCKQNSVVYKDGCRTCTQCGWSGCS